VNVSRFGPKLAGAGGFINISQNARRVVFAGTFTAGGLEVEVKDGRMRIKREGRSRKFVKKVGQVTFNGGYAAENDQAVLYVTERCVFRRTKAGMELTEVAPGIDVKRDILAHMDFEPIVRDPVPMDPRIFREEPMQLDETLLGLGLAQRVSYDAERNVLFLNLEGMRVKTRDDVDRVRRVIEERVQSIGHKVALIVNYDDFMIDASVADTYAAMVRYMDTHYYTTASRYTTSAFLRLKLGEALSRRRVKPHIFERREDAQAFVEGHEGEPGKL
jgi:propionate CoA-transferase